MIINGNINNDNEDKEVDDMLALLQAIRDYIISITEKRGFPSTIAMLRLDEILTACGSNDSNVSRENAIKMDKLTLFALGAAQVQGFTGEEYLDSIELLDEPTEQEQAEYDNRENQCINDFLDNNFVCVGTPDELMPVIRLIAGTAMKCANSDDPSDSSLADLILNDSGTIITMLAAYEHETIENMIARGITYGDKQIKNLIFDFIAAHHDELMPDSADNK